MRLFFCFCFRHPLIFLLPSFPPPCPPSSTPKSALAEITASIIHLTELGFSSSPKPFCCRQCQWIQCMYSHVFLLLHLIMFVDKNRSMQRSKYCPVHPRHGHLRVQKSSDIVQNHTCKWTDRFGPIQNFEETFVSDTYNLVESVIKK